MPRIRVAIDISSVDKPYAAEAAARLSADADRMTAVIDHGRALVEATASEAEVRHRWRVGLLNERLVSLAAARRANVLAALIA